MAVGTVRVLRWEDPPPPATNYRHPVGHDRRDWRAVVDTLRDQPNRWGLISESVSADAANAARQRLLRWAGRRNIEICFRAGAVPRSHHVYARWLAEHALAA